MYTKDSQHVSLTIDEARNFFEEYIAESEWPPKSKVSGLSPGNFTPEWDDALSFADATAAFLNIPLAGANLYGGYFSEDYATQSQAYYTCISQKLLIAKNANGEMTCAIISIIPSHDCATLSYDEAGKRFNHGAKNPDFSGIVMYSSVEGNYTLLVNRFHKGVLTAGATLSADNYDKSIADMKSLLAYTRIMRNLHQNPAVKSGEYSSWGTLDLDEAVVTAPATNYNFGNYSWWGYVYDYSGGGSGDYIGYIDCGGSGGGGSGSSGNNGSNNSSSSDPLVNSVNSAIKSALETVLNELKNDCLGAYIYNKLISRNVKLDFILNNSPDAHTGGYLNNSIFFNSVGSVNYSVMTEELIHALQHKVYGTAAMNNARENVEFEAKMIRELLAKNGLVKSGTCCASEFSEFGSKVQFKADDFWIWLFESQQNRTQGIPMDWEGYKFFEAEFGNVVPIYKGTYNPNFSPDVLKQLMSDSKNMNCVKLNQ